MKSRFLPYFLTFSLLSLCITISLTAYLILSKGRNFHVGARDEIKNHSGGLSVGGLLKHTENHTHAPLLHNVVDEPDKCKQLRKPTEIRYRHTHWQVQQDGQEDIAVYSAFYDDRPIVGVLPWIRILGVRRLSDNPLWCYVWYSQTEIPFIAEAEIIKTGNDHRVNDSSYSQNLFSCQLSTSNVIPTHVSIATRRCANSTIFLEIVHSPKSDKWAQNFGICVAVGFGNYPPELIVEWMEAYSLFGVTHVSIYNGSIDSRLDRVFDYYRQKGILTLRQMPPSVHDYSKGGVRLGCPASLNDCMMRNMYSHRFIVVVDFDEIIVPRIHNNYLDMLEYIDRSENRSESHHTYSFRNTYFFKYFPEDESQPKFLQTLRLRHRAQPSDYLIAPKSFVDPRRCKSVFNHYCWSRFPNSGPLTVDVNTSVALSHHYRSSCPFDKTQCENYDKKKVSDNTMVKYKDVLLKRVSEVLNAIGVII